MEKLRKMNWDYTDLYGAKNVCAYDADGNKLEGPLGFCKFFLYLVVGLNILAFVSMVSEKASLELLAFEVLSTVFAVYVLYYICLKCRPWYEGLIAVVVVSAINGALYNKFLNDKKEEKEQYKRRGCGKSC